MNQPLFIAEVSSNHSQNLERSLKFVDVAAESGCQAVKFQLFKIEELFHSHVVKTRQDIAARKAWELPVEFLPHLAKRSKQKGIQFSCTPFYLKAVDELAPYVDFYKIASYEILWHDLFVACAKTGKPVVFSTGMATMDEVASSVKVLREAGCKDITILHCISNYPAPIEQCNLKAIQSLRNEFNVKVGWSDHTVSEAVMYRAIHTHGAEVIELHLDLDGEGAEFGPGHCWLPGPVKKMISNIVEGMQADGSGIKGPMECEMFERTWRADPVDGLRPVSKTRDSF